MIGFNILLSAFFVVGTPENTDTIRTERLDEVVVTSNSAQQRILNVQTGAEVLQIEHLTASPQLFGEKDIMRSLQLLPGVKAESDASSSFQVRGGTSAQNQVLFDLAPVYNVGHAGGLFSAFNDDAVASGTLYKGLLPAQYGGASSAVLDITGRTGNKNSFHGGATIGLISAKATVEGPIVKGKGAFLVTARRSYLDMFLKLSPEFRSNTMFFYDVNAKLDWSFNAKNHLYLTFFTGHDHTAVTDMVDVRWYNFTTSLKWVHQFNDKLHSQTSLFYSAYQNDNAVDFVGTNVSYKGHIKQTSLRQDFNYDNGNYHLKAGLQTSLLNVKSAEWLVVKRYNKEERRAWENAFWVNGTAELFKDMTASVGLRLNLFSPLGGSPYYDIAPDGTISRTYDYGSNEIVKTHAILEPRASLSYQMNDVSTIKLAYARSSQNIHAVRNQSTSTPFDRYAISSNIIKPEIANQFSIGYYMMTPDQDYDFSVETYYRKTDNVIDYRDGKSFSSEIEIERLVLPGEGKSYGIEFCARKNQGALTGWLSYTLAWSKTHIEGVNNGNWYDANNDRRHDINIVAMYRLNNRWTFNAAWVFNSGQAFTVPCGKYQLNGKWVYYYAERNGYRAPNYHRLDISAVWSKQKKRYTYQWIFGIYNLYNRYNPYLISFEDKDDSARTKATQYSLFGIIPSVAFNIKF